MKITPLDFLRYEIQGEQGIYLVDLELNACSCPHYTCRIAPKKVSETSCKHLKAVKIYAFDEIKPMLVKHWRNKNEIK